MKAEIRSLALGIVACLPVMMYAHSAVAQVDLSGAWGGILGNADGSGGGRVMANYLGIPLNNEGKEHLLLSWTPETINQPERQCEPWSMTYFLTGAASGKIWASVNPDDGIIDAWNIGGESGDREPITIWMPNSNVQAPSPQALDIPGGFTTGRWEGDTLVTTTTHIQDGYQSQNGVPISDQAVVTMYLTRHADLLTILGVIKDPVYLEAPWVLVGNSVYNPHSIEVTGPPSIGGNVAMTCQPGEEVTSVLNDHVPSYLVESQNPELYYMTQRYHIPHEAALGGAETIYPPYIKKINSQYTIPTNYCAHDCCSPGFGGPGGGADRAALLKLCKIEF